MLYGTPGTVLTRACLGDRAGAKRVSGKTPCRQPGECELRRIPRMRTSPIRSSRNFAKENVLKGAKFIANSSPPA